MREKVVKANRNRRDLRSFERMVKLKLTKVQHRLLNIWNGGTYGIQRRAGTKGDTVHIDIFEALYVMLAMGRRISFRIRKCEPARTDESQNEHGI
jgi:hypothetical protein